MQELGANLEEREFSKQPLTADEIRSIAGGRPVSDLLNPARDAYREKGFDRRAPSDDEALAAIADESNLLYRPIAIKGDRMVLGYQEEELRALAAEE